MVVVAKKFKFLIPWSYNARTYYGRCRIGCRDVVGYGMNGCYNYKDDVLFPFPAVRFKENTTDICALREKERGDWKQLCCEEKKALYRASFCQTFAEFQAPTGEWKFVIGYLFMYTSLAFWIAMFYHHYVYEGPLPKSFCKASQQAQLRRMLELRVNPIDGISSLWDYDNDRWKVAIVLALVGMVVANPVQPQSAADDSEAESSLLSSAIVTSSVINHGITIPAAAVRPIVSAPIIRPILTAPVIRPVLTAPIIRPVVTAPLLKAPLVSSIGLGGWGGLGWGGLGLGGLGWKG